LEQRLGYLKNQRRVDASAARSLLQQVWKSENAATRSELLSALETGLGAEDEPWIAELLSDKSIKVREEALRLLKILPHSSLVQRYQEVLAAAVSVKKEKGLLGLGSKTTLEVVLPAGSDDLYKTGLEKTSSEKGVSDEAHLLYQLVASVPPQFWETQLQKAPADIVDLFAKHPAGKNLLPALAKGTAQFADEAWARVLSERAGDFYPGLLPVLPAAGWERYVLEHFNAHSEPIVAAALQRNAPWSPDLARAILKHTAQHGYHYPPHFYNNIAHLLPLDILPGLESFAPSDAYMLDIWNRTKEQIKRLLTLKSRIPAAFAGGPSVYNEPFIIHPT
ncbi:MAG TPA: DUF5691 domain-containing protein, partial [Chitinophagaceae bacterium]|nr:DUF5691 domain-containing protein [Chitinophagaceae bacterium]